MKYLLWLNILVKVLAVGIVVFALLFPLPQFHGKAMGWRLVLYGAASITIPLIWRLKFRKAAYPHLIDIFFMLPYVIDNLGNVFYLYNTIAAFDDVAHWFNWALLTVAFGSAVSTLKLNKKIVAGLTIGFGATTHILWEIGEYIVMLVGSSGLQLSYPDTMFDFITSGVGTLTGALLVVTVFWKATLMPKRKKQP